MKSLFPLLALCMFVGIIGCTNQTKTPADKKSQTKASTSAEPETKGVELKVVKLSEFHDAVKEQKGKVVVIDFWATWCPPCMKAFPHHVELQHKYHDKDVVCMSVSMDEAKDKDQAQQFLVKQKATFPNFLPGDDIKGWYKHWQFDGIPATMVYDQSGKLHKFTNDDPDKGFTSADVEKFVEKLVKK